MSSAINPAVKANLERVIADEQRTTVRRMAWLRFALSSVAVLAVLPLAGRADLRPTLIGSVVFFGLSLIILLVIRRFPRLGAWAWLSTVLVDVPALATVQFIQQSRLPSMWDGIPSNLALMLMLIAASSLSLSPPVIYATAALASVSMQLMLYRAGSAYFPMAMVGLSAVATAYVASSMVKRFKAMVHAARRRDLVGKYVLGERLGAGGMAEVFSATYSPEGGFERRVAVKKILPSISQSHESIALFRREAELGAMLAHPNVVQVLDFGTDGDTWFLAMEYIEGVPLSRLLNGLHRAGQQLPIPVAIYVLGQLAGALDYIHQRTTPTGAALHLIHRDINPPNVLVSSIGEVKLGDFGIARAADHQSLTAAGVVRGKIGYSAPEQLLGQPYDSRADLFALGATAHEMLTGKRMFKGDSEVTLLMDCLHAPLRPPSADRPEIPASVDQLVMGLIDRELTRRTPTARELIRQLFALPAALTDEKEGRRLLAEQVVRTQQLRPVEVATRLGAEDPTAEVRVAAPPG